jgi:hypothetical protein
MSASLFSYSGRLREANYGEMLHDSLQNFAIALQERTLRMLPSKAQRVQRHTATSFAPFHGLAYVWTPLGAMALLPHVCVSLAAFDRNYEILTAASPNVGPLPFLTIATSVSTATCSLVRTKLSRT